MAGLDPAIWIRGSSRRITISKSTQAEFRPRAGAQSCANLGAERLGVAGRAVILSAALGAAVFGKQQRAQVQPVTAKLREAGDRRAA